MSNSSLQCLEAIKRTSRAPSTKSLESAAISPSHSRGHQERKRETKNRLYDITIVEENGSQVKVHYCGYSSQYDEWKAKSEVVYNKPKFNDIEQDYSALTELACSIKKGLLPSRKEDPEVRIQVLFDLTSFKSLQERGILRPQRGRSGTEMYTIQKYSDLDDVFGERWHIRIVNHIGDFSYVILETVSFYFSRSRPIKEYEVQIPNQNQACQYMTLCKSDLRIVGV